MALFSLEGERQNAIGRKDYWRRFEGFYGTQLHRLFVDEIIAIIEKHTSGGVIDSRQYAKTVLTKLERSSPELMNEWDSEELAGLFGMTMWNVIANYPESWHFYRTIGKDGELRGTQYWRG